MKKKVIKTKKVHIDWYLSYKLNIRLTTIKISNKLGHTSGRLSHVLKVKKLRSFSLLLYFPMYSELNYFSDNMCPTFRTCKGVYVPYSKPENVSKHVSLNKASAIAKIWPP